MMEEKPFEPFDYDYYDGSLSREDLFVERQSWTSRVVVKKPPVLPVPPINRRLAMIRRSHNL